MKDLIEALTIFAKYLKNPNANSPTHCEHDVLNVMDVTFEQVSEEDRKRLDELSFRFGDAMGCGEPCWYSNRFGSA